MILSLIVNKNLLHVVELYSGIANDRVLTLELYTHRNQKEYRKEKKPDFYVRAKINF